MVINKIQTCSFLSFGGEIYLLILHLQVKDSITYLTLVNTIKFELCPTLENVIFSVNFDLTELSPNCHPKVGYAGKLNFNPKVNQNSFGIEHVSWILFPITSVSTETYNTLNFIGQNAKNVTDITLSIFQWANLEMLKITFENMFKGLNGTLKTLHLNNMGGLVIENIILKALSENGANIENLNIFPNQRYWTALPELDKHFKNLRNLTVPTFYHIDCLVRDCKTLHDLCIERVSLVELKNSNMSEIIQRYRNLRRIKIYVIVTNKSDSDQCSEWENALSNEHRDIIEVNIVNNGVFQSNLS